MILFMANTITGPRTDILLVQHEDALELWNTVKRSPLSLQSKYGQINQQPNTICTLVH